MNPEDFDKFAMPVIRKSFDSGVMVKEKQVVQVGVDVEVLPAAEDGEIQVGEGTGPKETPVYEERIVEREQSIIESLVSVQPMQQSAGLAFALRSRLTKAP